MKERRFGSKIMSLVVDSMNLSFLGVLEVEIPST